MPNQYEYRSNFKINKFYLSGYNIDSIYQSPPIWKLEFCEPNQSHKKQNLNMLSKNEKPINFF